MERVPLILFDTQGNAGFWDDMLRQINTMVSRGRAPAWILDNIVITDDPEVVIDVYRQRLQLF
jgi:predicted Rossmann-fold nucleotide-binding protein